MKSRKFSAFLLTLLFFSFTSAFEAHAHSQMIQQFPKGNSTISEIPAEVDLIFDEELLDLGSGNSVTVKDPQGIEITTGPTYLLSSKISRKLLSSTTPGIYTVSYRIVSGDGHVVESFYHFTLQIINDNQVQKSVANPVETVKAIPNESKPVSVEELAHEEHPQGFFLHHLNHIIVGTLALLFIGIWAIASRRKWRELPD